MKFKTPLVAHMLRDGKGYIKLVSPLVYDDITVPAGFESDGASIPRLFWWLIGGPFSGKYRDAAVLHDYLCKHPDYTRKQADDIFLEAMAELGVALWRRDLMWRAVSLMQKGDITDVQEIKTIND